MKLLFSLTYLLFFLFAQHSNAQAPSYYHQSWNQKKVFLGWDGEVLTTPENARFYRLINLKPNAKNQYRVEDYLMNDQLVRIAHFEEPNLINLQGEFICYYHSGELKSKGMYFHNERSGEWDYWYPKNKFKMTVTYFGSEEYQVEVINHLLDRDGNYLVKKGSGEYESYYLDFHKLKEKGKIKNGLKAGEWKGYYLNGKLKYREIYRKGELKKGIFYARTDAKYKYRRQEFPASPQKGFYAFQTYIDTELRRNQHLLTESGEVVLQFRVEIDGSLTNFRVLHSLSEQTNQEAIRIIKNFGSWTPQKVRGCPRPSYVFYGIHFNQLSSSVEGP